MHPNRQQSNTSLPPLSHLYLPPHYAPYPPPQHPAPEPDIYNDSEPDDPDLHGPPKKKRRRQALSCTECKRRKIKCDRNQPCAPCTRRGEQAKCQWHVVEPIEKYVTRSEYDELKERVNQLSVLVNRLANHPALSPSGAPPEAVSSYHPLMRPPQNYPQQPSTSTDPSARYSKPDEPPLPKSPTAAAALPKSSPLSLAAITSPFTPSAHSKNCPAQTFILGERLRLGPKGPVILTPRRRRIPIGIPPPSPPRPANASFPISLVLPMNTTAGTVECC